MKELENESIFDFQQSAMPVLLGWAAGSIVAGVVWMRGHSPFLRGLGGQFAGWGLINGIIAGFGLLGARRNQERWLNGQISPEQHMQMARQFETIVWVNAVLDIGYILGGRWFARRDATDDTQRGVGNGIMLQGAFLLVWDIILGVLMRRRRNGSNSERSA